MQVANVLKNRSLQVIFITCVYDLKDFQTAIEVIRPKAVVRPYIVHTRRNSLSLASWKRQKEVAADFKQIHTSATAKLAEQRLFEFKKKER